MCENYFCQHPTAELTAPRYRGGIIALNDGFFAGFGQPLGRAEAVLREDDLSDDSRSHQSPERPSVGRSEEQRATEELNGLRRHHGRIHAGKESPT